MLSKKRYNVALVLTACYMILASRVCHERRVSRRVARRRWDSFSSLLCWPGQEREQLLSFMYGLLSKLMLARDKLQ